MKSVFRFIKVNLHMFQFMAVILTIGLASHTILDRFSAKSGLVIIFDVDRFSVASGVSSLPYLVTLSRKKVRDDCPLSSFKASVLTSDGFIHQVSTSIGQSSGDISDEFAKFQYYIQFNFPQNVSIGKARLRGQIIYECPEGRQVISYPNHENLDFYISGKP